MQQIPLILFAKAPVAGHVKTRLCAVCSPKQAAAIAEILLRASLRGAVQHWPDQVILAAWPDTSNNRLQSIAREFDVPLIAQRGADLGEKMFNTMQEIGFPSAVMGADAPHIHRRCFTKAHHVLKDGHNVIGPSTDGGYYLIGLAEPQWGVFEEVEWGTERVLPLTLSRTRFAQLAELTDIDHWPDVQRLAPTLPELQQYLHNEGLS